MDQKAFSRYVVERMERCHELLVIKGGEYAGSEDRLANFKRVAANLGITPLQAALTYASKHFDSICTFVRKDAAGAEQVLSEPIQERFADLVNYCLLMGAIVAEQMTPKPCTVHVLKPDETVNENDHVVERS